MGAAAEGVGWRGALTIIEDSQRVKQKQFSSCRQFDPSNP